MDPRERFELGESVGRDELGEVFRGEERDTGQAVAVKVFDAWALTEVARREQYQAALAALSDIEPARTPQVVGYSIGEENAWVATRWVEAPSLQDFIDAQGALDEESAAAVSCGVLDALLEIHATGHIHGGIIPKKILLVDGLFAGGVALTDPAQYYLYSVGDPIKVTRTDPDRFVGVPQYYSPEQARGDDADARSDVYAVGLITYELLTGKTPFASRDAATTLKRHIYEKPVPPRLSKPGLQVSKDAEAILMTALQKEPEQRFQSVLAFRRALSSIRKMADEVAEREATPLNTAPSRVLSGEIDSVLPTSGAVSRAQDDIEAPTQERPADGTDPMLARYRDQLDTGIPEAQAVDEPDDEESEPTAEDTAEPSADEDGDGGAADSPEQVSVPTDDEPDDAERGDDAEALEPSEEPADADDAADDESAAVLRTNPLLPAIDDDAIAAAERRAAAAAAEATPDEEKTGEAAAGAAARAVSSGTVPSHDEEPHAADPETSESSEFSGDFGHWFAAGEDTGELAELAERAEVVEVDEHAERHTKLFYIGLPALLIVCIGAVFLFATIFSSSGDGEGEADGEAELAAEEAGDERVIASADVARDAAADAGTVGAGSVTARAGTAESPDDDTARASGGDGDAGGDSADTAEPTEDAALARTSDDSPDVTADDGATAGAAAEASTPPTGGAGEESPSAAERIRLAAAARSTERESTTRGERGGTEERTTSATEGSRGETAESDSSASESGAGEGDDVDTRERARALTRQAENALRSRNYPRARELFEQALAADSRYAPAHHGLGDLHFQQADYAQAAQHHLRATRLAPSRGAYHASLGKDYFRLGNYRAALDAFERAADRGDTDAVRFIEITRERLGGSD